MNVAFVPRDPLQRLDTQSPLRAEGTFIDEMWPEEEDPACPREQAAKSMAGTVAMATGLRPFPEVADAVLTVTSRPDVDLEHLCLLIESDPALASKMLRLANSAHLRRRTECRNLRQAVQRLGFKMVRGLALSVATLATYSDPFGEARRIREHCAGTAAVVRVLTGALDRKVMHEAFLCGLLHDFGKLLLHQAGEVNYATIGGPEKARGDDLARCERVLLGYDHAVLGGWVLHQWDIPEPVPRVVAQHHQQEACFLDNGPLGRLTAWLQVADELDHHIVSGVVADEHYFELYAKKPAFVRVGLTAKDLMKHWGGILAEREHTLQVFSG
jgi:HD-like signal output (HDOD) protein